MSIAGVTTTAGGAARSLVAAGAALVSLGAVSASPVAAPVPNPPMSAQAYTLAASSDLLNVPLNMLNMVLSIPAWEVQAMNRLADAMIGTGSWQVWGPTNVFGFDEWDPPKLAGVIDMMMPVQPFSSVFADQINWWAKANVPMNAGCAAAPGACPDFWAAARGYLKVPTTQLNDGYQFPAVINPFTLQPTSWSGTYVKLDPGAAFSSLWNYLSGEPTGVQTVPIGDYFTVPFKLATSIFDAFYPFVQNSEWFNPTTPFSWVFRAVAPVLCPSCGPEPYDNPWLKNYPPVPAATRKAPAPAATVATPPPVAAVTPTPVTVSAPVIAPPAVAAAAAAPAPERAEAPVPPAVDRPDVTQPPDLAELTVSPPANDSADTGQFTRRGRAAVGQFSADRSVADPAGGSRANERTRGRAAHPDAAAQR